MKPYCLAFIMKNNKPIIIAAIVLIAVLVIYLTPSEIKENFTAQILSSITSSNGTYLLVKSTPSYATIKVDGVSKGKTPKLISGLTEEKHRVEIVGLTSGGVSYRSANISVSTNSKRTTTLKAKLIPLSNDTSSFGNIFVTADKGLGQGPEKGSIYLKESGSSYKFQGNSPIMLTGLNLTGKQVKMTRFGYRATEVSVTPKGGKITSVVIVPVLSSSPAGITSWEVSFRPLVDIPVAITVENSNKPGYSRTFNIDPAVTVLAGLGIGDIIGRVAPVPNPGQIVETVIKKLGPQCETGPCCRDGKFIKRDENKVCQTLPLGGIKFCYGPDNPGSEDDDVYQGTIERKVYCSGNSAECNGKTVDTARDKRLVDDCDNTNERCVKISSQDAQCVPISGCDPYYLYETYGDCNNWPVQDANGPDQLCQYYCGHAPNDPSSTYCGKAGYCVPNY